MLTTVMPFRLGQDPDRVFALVAACVHLLNEPLYICSLHAQGLDPPHLAAMNAMVTLSLIDGYDCIFRHIFAIAVAQIEQFPVIKTVAKRPFVVGHCFHQVVLALDLLE